MYNMYLVYEKKKGEISHLKAGKKLKKISLKFY
jgi:hypothetical protein